MVLIVNAMIALEKMVSTKMTATMLNMEYTFADHLSPDQLMEDDIIKFENEMYIVKNVSDLAHGYSVKVVNDFGETDELLFADDALIEWYVLIDE